MHHMRPQDRYRSRSGDVTVAMARSYMQWINGAHSGSGWRSYHASGSTSDSASTPSAGTGKMHRNSAPGVAPTGTATGHSQTLLHAETFSENLLS